MIVNTNIASMNAQKSLLGTNNAMQKSLEKLSSGSRINKAADDAAGLAMSEKMRGQIKGLNQAVRNAQSAISLTQTAEGALNETHSILQRMRELAVQSASDTNTTDDRSKIQAEMDQLSKEITRISNTTEFNTQNLLAGGLDNTFHIGANAGQNIDLGISAMDAQSLGVASNNNLLGTFAASTTTLSSSNIDSTVGKGLTAQTYNIVVDHTAAAVTETGDTIGGTGTVTGTGFTGDRDEASVQFKVTAVSADAAKVVTAMEYTTDGGSTWNSASVAAGVVTYKGAELTMTADASNAVGQTYTADFTARKDSIQLQDASTANIGSAVSAYGDMTSVTIGDASSSRALTINSTNLGDLVDGTATQGIIVQASAAAVTGTDGSVTTAAVAHAGIDVSTQAAANTAITTIDASIQTVSEERSKLGAMQNRLEHTINNLQTASENMTSAESRIRDVDMAAEMSTFTKSQILSQAGVAMLAQANQVPQAVLKLLG